MYNTLYNMFKYFVHLSRPLRRHIPWLLTITSLSTRFLYKISLFFFLKIFFGSHIWSLFKESFSWWCHFSFIRIYKKASFCVVVLFACFLLFHNFLGVTFINSCLESQILMFISYTVIHLKIVIILFIIFYSHMPKH